jgi:hypothetical protein
VTRPALTGLILVVGLLLVTDLVVVNESLGELAALIVGAAILVAAGASLAAVAALAVRRGTDLWRRRGDPVGAALVLVGIGAMLVAGLWPGSRGAGDPVVGWLIAALLLPIGATLFGLLFLTTLTAARRAVALRQPDAALLVGSALVAVLLLLPLGGGAGEWLATASAWALAVPIGAALRGLLIGIAILAAVVAARTLFGIGAGEG